MVTVILADRSWILPDLGNTQNLPFDTMIPGNFFRYNFLNHPNWFEPGTFSAA